MRGGHGRGRHEPQDSAFRIEDSEDDFPGGTGRVVSTTGQHACGVAGKTQTHNQTNERMKGMKFRRFTRAGFLRGIGQPVLGRFLGRFAPELTAAGIMLPAQDDEDFAESVAGICSAPEGLPEALIEAMFEIEELANAEGRERIERAVLRSGLAIAFDADATHADLAMEVWLSDPALVARCHNESRLNRLTAFEYFSNPESKPQMRADKRGWEVEPRRHEGGEGERRTGIRRGLGEDGDGMSGVLVPVGGGPVEPTAVAEAVVKVGLPDKSTMAGIVADLDEWFATHGRGEGTTHIETHEMEGELWFVIRHGDTWSRMPTVRGRGVNVLHFRPTKDDVVVYSPKRDDLRIHARTKGERELYRTTFGRRLFKNARRFDERRAYTLEPLRAEGIDALDVDASASIRRIVLRRYEVAWDTGRHETLARTADDLFAQGRPRSIPESGRLVRAVFDVHFTGCRKPRPVEVRPPNVLKLGRHCDAAAVHGWLEARGFRTGN